MRSAPNLALLIWTVAFCWLAPVVEVLGEESDRTPRPVVVDIRVDKPTLRLLLLREAAIGDRSQPSVTWPCDGGCRLSLPPGNYTLKMDIPPGGGFGGYTTQIMLTGDAAIDVVGPHRHARMMGLVAVIGGGVVAGGSAFVLFATLLGHTMADCESGTTCHGWTQREKINAGLWAGAGAIGLTTAVLGLWIMDRNSAKVTARPQRDSTSRLSVAPVPIADGWSLIGASAF